MDGVIGRLAQPIMDGSAARSGGFRGLPWLFRRQLHPVTVLAMIRGWGGLARYRCSKTS